MPSRSGGRPSPPAAAGSLWRQSDATGGRSQYTVADGCGSSGRGELPQMACRTPGGIHRRQALPAHSTAPQHRSRSRCSAGEPPYGSRRAGRRLCGGWTKQSRNTVLRIARLRGSSGARATRPVRHALAGSGAAEGEPLRHMRHRGVSCPARLEEQDGRPYLAGGRDRAVAT